MLKRFAHWLAFRWFLSVIMGGVAAVVLYLFPDMSWLQRTGVLFVAAIVIGRLLKPYRRRSAWAVMRSGR